MNELALLGRQSVFEDNPLKVSSSLSPKRSCRTKRADCDSMFPSGSVAPRGLNLVWDHRCRPPAWFGEKTLVTFHSRFRTHEVLMMVIRCAWSENSVRFGPVVPEGTALLARLEKRSRRPDLQSDSNSLTLRSKFSYVFYFQIWRFGDSCSGVSLCVDCIRRLLFEARPREP